LPLPLIQFGVSRQERLQQVRSNPIICHEELSPFGRKKSVLRLQI
jgi:hypothetical protein